MTIQNANQVLPSGSEVESAAFRGSVGVDHQLPAADDSALRHKVDNLKSRGLAAIRGMQRSLATRVNRTSDSVRGSVQNGMSQVQLSMRHKPMMWAGIAGGTGMALGLIGRFLHWRRDHRGAVPDLVIIESAC